MLRKRVIPTLLIDNNRLLKGSEFKNHNYVGDPINIVKIFNEKYVDELLIYDINNNLDSSLNYQLLNMSKKADIKDDEKANVFDYKSLQKRLVPKGSLDNKSLIKCG